MKKWSKSFTIKILSITSGKIYYCRSMKLCEEKTGVSYSVLSAIRTGKRSSFVTNSKGVIYQIQFIADKAVTFYPTWDTGTDGTRPKSCSSHKEAILFISDGGPSPTCKKSTYQRRLKEHFKKYNKDEPCEKTIKDAFGREWIIVFHEGPGEFILNKKKGGD